MSDALDGLLQGPDRERFERHLDKCKDCRGQYELLSKSIDLVRSMPHPQAPEELSERIRRRLRRKGAMKKKATLLRSLVPFEAAIVVMVAAVAVWLFTVFGGTGITPVAMPHPTVEVTGAEQAKDLVELALESGWRVVAGGKTIDTAEPIPPGRIEIWVAADQVGAFAEKVAKRIAGVKVHIPSNLRGQTAVFEVKILRGDLRRRLSP